MNSVVFILAVMLGYLIGSMPFGLVIVRIATGKDIREVGSGRTGGTNAMRAAGFGAGLLTALLDIFKVTAAVVLATWITGNNHWAEALAGAMAVLGHNNSLFLARRVITADGRTRLQFQGGAGGAPAVGGALGLWPLSVAFVLPAGLFFLFIIGYASVATMSVGLVATIVFAARAAFFGGPWEHVAYGALTLALQVWALRPNIRRLLDGNERLVSMSLRAKRQAKLAAESNGQPNK